jgi:hypothetical protein
VKIQNEVPLQWNEVRWHRDSIALTNIRIPSRILVLARAIFVLCHYEVRTQSLSVNVPTPHVGMGFDKIK